jgi:predicted Holliday junction resolvase-like endonuclease
MSQLPVAIIILIAFGSAGVVWLAWNLIRRLLGSRKKARDERLARDRQDQVRRRIATAAKELREQEDVQEDLGDKSDPGKRRDLAHRRAMLEHACSQHRIPLSLVRRARSQRGTAQTLTPGLVSED